MKTGLFEKLSLLILTAILIVSCTSSSSSKFISIKDYSFAKSNDDGQLIIVDDPVFSAGESVHLVLMDVGPFRKDDEGLNWFDIDMEITGPDDEIVISATELLGVKGHVKLENNRAESPYATCYTTPELKTGTYKFKMTIYDKIGNGKATQTAKFRLE